MNHSFLLQSAKWSIEGNYLDRDKNFTPIKGSIAISWKRESWFNMITRLSLNQESPQEIISRCKGHFDNQRKSYTYVLQHSILGNIEGEGWLSSDSIIQNYWVVGATQRRLGFDTFYRLSENTYHFTNVYLENLNLTSTMEATLKHLI